VSFATAVFPLLSKLWESKETKEFLSRFSQTFLEVLYVAFPIGILIFILRQPIVDIIYRTGRFDMSATAITAACLGLYFISTAVQCLVPILLRGFFSIKNTFTPTVIALINTLFNIIFFFVFVSLFGGGNHFGFNFFGHPVAFSLPAYLNGNNFLANGVKSFMGLNGVMDFPVLGLVLAFNLGLFLEFVLLFIYFYKKVGNFGLKEMWQSFLKILAGSAVMAAVAAFAFAKTGFLFKADFWGSLGQFVFITLIAAGVYLLITFALKSPEIKFLKKYFPILFPENGNEN
ncbi:MAG: lipid II flippase MurJ, partial [Candidatus Pacebacteria bacterium]|nr:lipid II flippase MurJ [Candidatus Paceibacterota bacterium]